MQAVQAQQPTIRMSEPSYQVGCLRLTENYPLIEFLHSETADNLGIDMTPPEWVVANLKHLAVVVLEPVRAVLGHRSVFVTSGWRPLAVNRAVGGSATSGHLFGLAADVWVQHHDPYEAAARIAASAVPFDQLILYPFRLHLGAVAPGGTPRREVLTAVIDQGQKTYLPGLQETGGLAT